MESVELIAVAELADELGTRRATLFKIIKRLGLRTVKRRDSDRGGQHVALVTPADASSIREAFNAGRRSVIDLSDDGNTLASEVGWLYLVQLEPDYDPGRFKVGFTTDLEGRLRHHRCAAPFAQYKTHWPCRRTWERAAIDCMTAGHEQLHTEVFRGMNLDAALARGQQFFSLMPTIGTTSVERDDEDR